MRDVSKTYRTFRGRQVPAVEGLSLEVAAGEVLGVAGPNGAGKSTLLGMLLGFLTPTSGALAIDGLEPRTYVERYGASYLPELMALPSHWTTLSALKRLAVLSGVPGRRIDAEVDRVIERLQIGEHRTKRLKALSKGNLQRVGLAQALLTDARLVMQHFGGLQGLSRASVEALSGKPCAKVLTFTGWRLAVRRGTTGGRPMPL